MIGSTGRATARGLRPRRLPAMARGLGPRRLPAVAVAVLAAGLLQAGGGPAWAAGPPSPDPGVGLEEDGAEPSGADCDAGTDAAGDSALAVTAITADRVPRHPARKYARFARDDRVSIPRQDEANTRQRYLDVEYALPAGVELTCVRVDLLDTTPRSGGTVLQTVTEAAPTADGGEGVRSVGRDRLKVRVTFDEQHPSKIRVKPAQVTRIGYRVSLIGEDQDGTVVAARKDSADFFPLWRMPAGLDRYGLRDDQTGGDDWCSSFTHGWLSSATGRALLPRVNDISGEHARNLGHQTHLTGDDIDAFHPYRFSGVDAGAAGSGGRDYARLVAATQAAMDGDADGLGQVKEWAEATRTRLGRLIDDRNVVRMYYASGSAVKGDPRFTAGWASALLRTGVYAYTDAKKETRELDLGIGEWSRIGNRVITAKDFRPDHNDHLHVTLSETRRK
ncbi:hypothetical protein BKM31_11905 [[Actinomadura] parvosata subsp. kistnae]|uniref:Uncharacterized protein n=1 Tax=[Actinomadura] parvosata subsp. kistnae TaxID=1909395 RepID=A0A1U9ZVU6_9ACTN|nr:hypothetical protein [Nonomuraea sp. ATCC 55076]AQZ62081.1 hypothetical protein BKM31_11905 [Nonomuraea sp. ATCC 55076]